MALASPELKLFVGAIPLDFKPHDLAQAFEKLGTVVSVKIQTGKQLGIWRGFGYVTIDTEWSPEKILSLCLFVGGRKLDVQLSRPSPISKASTRSPGCTSAQVTLFSSFPAGQSKEIASAGSNMQKSKTQSSNIISMAHKMSQFVFWYFAFRL